MLSLNDFAAQVVTTTFAMMPKIGLGTAESNLRHHSSLENWLGGALELEFGLHFQRGQYPSETHHRDEILLASEDLA
jgi:hypothetical protein